MRSGARTVLIAAAAAVLLAAASMLGIALLGPLSPGRPPRAAACPAPSLAGTTVNVTLSNMGAG
ncbi:hypothetical protein [Sinomonas sp. RB5]